MTDEPKELGDAVQSALQKMGITSDRVSRFLGVDDCGCDRRRKQLNMLGRWARNVFTGRQSDRTAAERQLNQILDG